MDGSSGHYEGVPDYIPFHHGGGRVFADPHIKVREFISEVDHPEVSKRNIPGVFAKLTRTPGAVRRHSPLLGEHTDYILNELLGIR